jgi:hypothetical protein
VGGDFHHLGRTHDPTFINGPLSVSFTRIPIVCSSVQEAELAAGRHVWCRQDRHCGAPNAKRLPTSATPKHPTIIHCDSEVAVGITNRTVKPKFSESCDMRLHWLQDRVTPLQFLVRHIPGLLNIGDYCTSPRRCPSVTTMFSLPSSPSTNLQLLSLSDWIFL